MIEMKLAKSSRANPTYLKWWFTQGVVPKWILLEASELCFAFHGQFAGALSDLWTTGDNARHMEPCQHLPA